MAAENGGMSSEQVREKMDERGRGAQEDVERSMDACMKRSTSHQRADGAAWVLES